MECHQNPEKALSDAATCLPLEEVQSIVRKLVKLKEVVNEL